MAEPTSFKNFGGLFGNFLHMVKKKIGTHPFPSHTVWVFSVLLRSSVSHKHLLPLQ